MHINPAKGYRPAQERPAEHRFSGLSQKLPGKKLSGAVQGCRNDCFMKGDANDCDLPGKRLLSCEITSKMVHNTIRKNRKKDGI